MGEPKTSRPFRERFLDNYDRSELQRQVAAVRPRKKLSGFRKRGASWALGASLALGGLGLPLKMIQKGPTGGTPKPQTAEAAQTIDSQLSNQLVGDIEAAESIARQVAQGVGAAAAGVESIAEKPLQVVAEAPKALGMINDAVRKDFFHSEVPFGSIIYSEAKKNNIRPELVAAVVQAESKFKPTARSGAGAIGLMQLVPRTGRWMGARDLTNPAQNISAGAKYLRYLSDRFDGNETKMIAAYNAGEGNVKRFGGVPPFRETRNYVSKVRDFEEDFHNRVENRAAEQTADAGVAGETR